MKTRMQPERQARQRRVKSDRQIKQPKLKQQIQPRSVSTSCSSIRTSQLRKNRESRLANMARRKHIWLPEEEEFLLECSKYPCMIRLYKNCKSHFYGSLAEAMNRHWVDERKDPEYVPLTIDKVKTKFKQFVTSWKAHCPSATEMGTSSGFGLFDKYSTQFNSLFNDNEATSSGSLGVKKKPTVPFDLQSALKYMNEYGCDSVEFFKYTTALENTTVLRGFLVMTTYEERKKYLTDLLERGVVKIPSCELAKTPSCSSC